MDIRGNPLSVGSASTVPTMQETYDKQGDGQLTGNLHVNGALSANTFDVSSSTFVGDLPPAKRLKTSQVSPAGDVEIDGNFPLAGMALITTDSTTATWQQPIAHYTSTGLLDGCQLHGATSGNPNEYNMSAGSCFFHQHAPGNATSTQVNFPAQENVVLADIGSRPASIITIDGTGLLEAHTTEPTVKFLRTHVIVGGLNHIDLATISSFSTHAQSIGHTHGNWMDLVRAVGIINDGNVMSGAGDMFLDKGAGTLFNEGGNYRNDPEDPNTSFLPAVTDGPFTMLTSDNLNITPHTEIQPDDFEPNAGGVLVTLSNPNTWQCQRIYMFTTGSIVIQPGQQAYSTLQNAVDGIGVDPFVTASQLEGSGLVVLAAYLVVELGTVDLSNARFIQAGKFQGSKVTVGSASTVASSLATSGPAVGITTSAPSGAVEVLTTTNETTATWQTLPVTTPSWNHTVGEVTPAPNDVDVVVKRITFNSEGSNGTGAVSVGNGSSASGNFAVAVGNGASASDVGGVSVGNSTISNVGSVSIGEDASTTDAFAVAVGKGSRAGAASTSVGYSAGSSGPGNASTLVGSSAGGTNCGFGVVAVGANSGSTFAADDSVLVGYGAGSSGSGVGSVIVGRMEFNVSTGAGAVVIGKNTGTGLTSVGSNSIVIGHDAVDGVVPSNLLVLNATGGAETIDANAGNVFLRPTPRTESQSWVLLYDVTTGEVAKGQFPLDVQITGGTPGNVLTVQAGGSSVAFDPPSGGVGAALTKHVQAHLNENYTSSAILNNPFNVQDFDLNAEYDPVTGYWTPEENGTYLVDGSFCFDTINTGDEIALYMWGTTDVTPSGSSTYDLILNLTQNASRSSSVVHSWPFSSIFEHDGTYKNFHFMFYTEESTPTLIGGTSLGAIESSSYLSKQTTQYESASGYVQTNANTRVRISKVN